MHNIPEGIAYILNANELVHSLNSNRELVLHVYNLNALS